MSEIEGRDRVGPVVLVVVYEEAKTLIYPLIQVLYLSVRLFVAC